jgi:hypothetical protein
MRRFEGNINGKIYTDEKEFDKALLQMEDTGDVYVSYKYVSIPDVNDETKLKSVDSNNESVKNYVSENEYVKNITNKKDVVLDADLISKLKNSSNQSDIKETACKKITDFDNKISDNLLHINELKSDYKKLDEKMKLINNQIKTLDDANNNYYLNKEYYTNIKDLFVEVDALDSNDKCECGCGCKDGECTCGCEECKCDSEKDEPITVTDIYNMTAYELAKHLNKNKIHTLGDLVEYFLKHY